MHVDDWARDQPDTNDFKTQTFVNTKPMSAPPPSLAAGSSAEVQAAAFADDPRYACFL